MKFSHSTLKEINVKGCWTLVQVGPFKCLIGIQHHGVGESNNNMGRPSEFETTKIVWGRCQMPNDVFLFCIQSVNYLKKSTYSNTVMLSNCFLIYFIKVN